MEDEELELQDLDDKRVNKINIFRARQLSQPYRRFNSFRSNKSGMGGQGVQSWCTNDQSNKNSNQNGDNWKCRYWNVPGHLQADCQKRKTTGVPLVDRHGKSLGGQNKTFREVESKEEDGFSGHLRHSSEDGCHSLKNQDNVNF
jgi:hypothetical protein